MAWRGPIQTPKNSPPNDVTNNSSVWNGNIDLKREDQIRRDQDNFKNYKITLEDIDATILNHLKDYVKPTVIENGDIVQVPVMFANPERWYGSQKMGYMRDQNGKIMRPVIALKRTSLSNDEPLTVNRHLTYQIEQKYSAKNRYDRINIVNNKIEPPTKEIYNIVMPDKVVLTYDVSAWTNNTEQMNEIIEKINFSTHDYWGDKKRFRFRTEVSDYVNQTETVQDQERVVKTNFTLTVYGRLLPEFYEDGTPTTQRRLNHRKIVIDTELKTSRSEFPPVQTSQNNLDIRFVDPNKNRKNVTNNK